MQKLFLTLLLGITLSSAAQAHHLLKEHPLTCDPHFPCPKELIRRVEFWIQVFNQYGTKQAVFHDMDHPDRVYSVLDTDRPCTKRREPQNITTERRRLRETLLELARKVEANETTWSEDESHLLRIFSGQPEDIREAADNVRCQMGNKDRFVDALKRWKHFRPMVLKALQEGGLSEDLQYLPFVESSYNPKAYSRVGAAGVWQIMPRTARRLGLKISDAVDERLDPELATHAAVKYFKNSYNELQGVASNTSETPITNLQLGPFVVTSYNYGTAGMSKALREVGTDFVKVLYEFGGRRFHIAVKNFYASFLAARYVAQNAEKFFGAIIHEPALEYDEVPVLRQTSAARLSKHFNVTFAELRELNPSLTERVFKGRRMVPAKFTLRIPKGKKPEQVVAELEKLPQERLQIGPESYRIERGDTLIGISREFKVALKDLMTANNFEPRSKIRIGQVITIPGRGEIVTEAPEPKVAMKKTETAPAAPFKIKVDAEETLDLYAEWIGHKNTKTLETVNKIEGVTELPIGKELEIPIKKEEEKKEFEAKRAGFHQTLQDEFKEHFDIVGQEIHRLGEKESVSPKEIAAKLDVPLWLFLQFNPDLFAQKLKPGDIVNFPVIVGREDDEGSD